MASINLSGVLRDPLGEVSYGNQVRFTHVTVTGETISGFRSQETIVIDGEYDFDLQYGNVHIETKDKLNYKWISHGTLTINSDTPAESLPALLGITTPATDADLLVFQALVADAETAADEAETAQAATEALFDDFTDSVAAELADISPANIDWDLVIPFNDGPRIEKGYGTFDTITVSSTDHELPTRSVDVSRASSVWGTNKSGIPTEFDEDELIIGSDGAAIFEGYTNELGYGMTSVGGWSTYNSTASDVTLDDVAYIKIVPSTASTGHHAGYSGTSPVVVTGDVVIAQFLIHKDSDYNFGIYLYTGQEGTIGQCLLDTSDGTLTQMEGTGLVVDNGTNYCVTLIATVTEDSSIEAVYAQAYDGTDASFAGDGTSSIYVSQRMLVINGPEIANLPYVDTPDSASASKPADVVSVTSNGNMPASGEPWYAMMDTSFLVLESANFALAQVDTTTEVNTRLFRSSDGYVYFYIFDKNSGSSVSLQADVDENRHRFIMSYDGANIQLFSDGALLGESTNESYICGQNTDVLMYFGSYEGYYFLNGGLDNFRLRIGTMTASLAAALGSAE